MGDINAFIVKNVPTNYEKQQQQVLELIGYNAKSLIGGAPW